MTEPRPSGPRRRIRLPRLIPATVVVVLLLFLASYLAQRRHAAAPTAPTAPTAPAETPAAPADTAAVPPAPERVDEDSLPDDRREGGRVDPLMP